MSLEVSTDVALGVLLKDLLVGLPEVFLSVSLEVPPEISVGVPPEVSAVVEFF